MLLGGFWQLGSGWGRGQGICHEQCMHTVLYLEGILAPEKHVMQTSPLCRSQPLRR